MYNPSVAGQVLQCTPDSYRDYNWRVDGSVLFLIAIGSKICTVTPIISYHF